MKEQVTSIEQSKRLIELGVPAEKASMVWDDSSCKGHILKIWDVDDETKAWHYRMDSSAYVPAFTVADLLGLLPNVIQDTHNTYELTLTAMVGGGWRFCYTPVLNQLEADNIGEEMADDLMELLCNRIEWLLSNGYKLEG